MGSRLDYGVLMRFARSLDRLAETWIDAKMREQNKIFRTLGICLRFRVSMNEAETAAIVWDTFGACLEVRAVGQGGVIILQKDHPTADLARVPESELERVMATIMRLSSKPLTREEQDPGREKFVEFLGKGEPAATIFDRRGAFMVVTSKPEAREHLGHMIENELLTQAGIMTLSNQIESSKLRAGQQLSERKIFSSGRSSTIVLDHDRVICYLK